MKTYAPSSTNRFAVAKPIPVVPPVTTATFPCSLPMIVAPYFSWQRARDRNGRFAGRRADEAGGVTAITSLSGVSMPDEADFQERSATDTPYAGSSILKRSANGHRRTSVDRR